MIQFPTYIDLEITANCNFDCGFCFGPIKSNFVDLPVEFWQQTILYFKNKGIKGVVFSGGEPTLYPNFIDLVKFTKQQCLSIILSSNGSNEKKLFEVSKYCDWISIPYDGICNSDLMKGHTVPLENIKKIALELKQKNENLKIKLGSVATKLNVTSLIEFAHIYKNIQIGLFDTWKIYQYSPRRSSIHLKEYYEITDTEFQFLNSAVNKIIGKNSNVVFSSNSNRNASYLFVYTNGDLVIPNIGSNMTDLVIGNLLNEKDQFNFELLSNINHSNHFDNFQNSYNLK